MSGLLRYLGTISAIFVAACSSTPVSQDAAPATAAGAGADAPSSSASLPHASNMAVQRSQQQPPAHLDPASLLTQERSVYFEYDTAEISHRYAPMIERHARYLKDHPSIRVIVEGHADERGGTEYNLALGQRRSEATRSALRLLGVKETQIEAISLGEEKPAALEHDERAWQLNRRADIMYAR